MEQIILQQLQARNKALIAAIIQKAQQVCPESIALIGITGSFYTGDIHPKSDLDLCIVINDPDGWKIAKCAIIGDVAHDIYCTSWEQLEALAQYDNPYITKLMELEIVYCADPQYQQRYLALRAKAQALLSAPLDSLDLQHINKHMDEASKAYTDLMLSDDLGQANFAKANLLYAIEFVLFQLNKRYIQRSVRHIPQDVCALPTLPRDFAAQYQQLINADTLAQIQASASSLLKNLRELIRNTEQQISSKQNLSAKALQGSYEEIVSNWQNKMQLATNTNDAYLALMTAASCQHFYDDMYKAYTMPRIDLMAHIDLNDLAASERAFNAALAKYRQLYADHGARIAHYATLDEFVENYLKS